MMRAARTCFWMGLRCLLVTGVRVGQSVRRDGVEVAVFIRYRARTKVAPRRHRRGAMNLKGRWSLGS